VISIKHASKWEEYPRGEKEMVLTARSFNRMREDMRIFEITEEQRTAIMERFGEEPYPYEWGRQDIAEQVQSYLNRGAF